ncbi:MAG: hypothetical protein M1818_001445 [Claussenomyces sp. TS43310]|nr:MAG: hypothetical protein M1818_001445 [Claussenomyces sp. TS43310]
MSPVKPVTEIANIAIKAGVDLSDEGTTAYKTWSEILRIISNQDGYQRLYWGPTIEDPSLIQLCIGWDSIESHEGFMKSPQYGPFVTAIGTISSTPPSLFHIRAEPFPPIIFGTAPVVEMATLYEAQASCLDNVKQFVQNTKDKMEGGLGSVIGSVVEEIQAKEGAGTGKAVLLCLGWESREAHMKFRETDCFKENINLLREGNGGIVMVIYLAVQNFPSHFTDEL